MPCQWHDYKSLAFLMYLLLSTFFELPLKPIIEKKTIQDETCSHHCSGKYIPLPYIYTYTCTYCWVVRYVIVEWCGYILWIYWIALIINKCMTLIGIMSLLRQLLKLKPWKGEILVGHGFRSQVTWLITT